MWGAQNCCRFKYTKLYIRINPVSLRAESGWRLSVRTDLYWLQQNRECLFYFLTVESQAFVYIHNLKVYQMHCGFTNSQWHVIAKDGCFWEKHLLTLPLFWFGQKSEDAWPTYVPWRESVHPSQQMHLAASRGEKLRELENCHFISSYQLMLRIKKSLLQIWKVDYTAHGTLSSSVQQLSPWPGDTCWSLPNGR